MTIEGTILNQFEVMLSWAIEAQRLFFVDKKKSLNILNQIHVQSEKITYRKLKIAGRVEGNFLPNPIAIKLIKDLASIQTEVNNIIMQNNVRKNFYNLVNTLKYAVEDAKHLKEVSKNKIDNDPKKDIKKEKLRILASIRQLGKVCSSTIEIKLNKDTGYVIIENENKITLEIFFEKGKWGLLKDKIVTIKCNTDYDKPISSVRYYKESLVNLISPLIESFIGKLSLIEEEFNKSDTRVINR